MDRFWTKEKGRMEVSCPKRLCQPWSYLDGERCGSFRGQGRLFRLRHRTLGGDLRELQLDMRVGAEDLLLFIIAGFEKFHSLLDGCPAGTRKSRCQIRDAG